MRWVKPLVVTAGTALIAGCSLIPLKLSGEFVEPPAVPETQVAARNETFAPPAECGGRLAAEQRMYLDLVHRMVEQDQHYAAIAHLDQLEKTAAAAPQSVYLRAEALRGSGQRDAAEKLYRSLLGGCMAGYGLHGLGLLAAAAGRMDQAEDFLNRACRESPVNAEAHNDLGMALLLRGRFESARQEFLTAAELNRKNPLPVENLIVLMLTEKHDQEAQRLADQRGLSEKDRERLAQRARRLTGQFNLGDPVTPPQSPMPE